MLPADSFVVSGFRLIVTTSSPQRDFAVEIVRKLREAGHVALFAGGCVRDLLLGRTPKDYDVATTANPDQVRDLFGHKRTLPVGASFGVIVVLAPRNVGHVEVATFRSEGPYHDGRRPSSVMYCTPEEDAKRRDFTINGMFYDPIDARVLDYVGGESDLAARIVRAIGDPHERVREDKLRMLRAVRFAATLEFALDDITANAVREMAGQLTIVSAERIAQELRKMLVDKHRRRAIELSRQVQLLEVFLPDLNDVDIEVTLRMLELFEHPTFELAMAALLHTLPANPIVNTVCRRLKLSNEEIGRITWLVAHQNDLVDAPTFPLSRLKRILAEPFRDDLVRLFRVKLLAEAADLHDVLFCDEYLATTPQSVIDPPPLISGDDLIRNGMVPSPRFKQILDSVRDAQLNLEIATPEEALELGMKLANPSL
jgi:tRNA nucleotidyltransferase/poly(A) polymerase